MGRKSVSEIDVTFGRALKMWWSFDWRAMLVRFGLVRGSLSKKAATADQEHPERLD
jgi:hypothetical protein